MHAGNTIVTTCTLLLMLLLVADAVEVVVIVVGGLLLVMLKHEMLVLDVLVKTEGIIINIADTTTAAAPCG